MSITFSVVLMFFEAASYFTAVGNHINNHYSDVTADNAAGDEETGDGRADEALLDVAFYLRMHKFNDFDRRYYLESNENSSYFYAQFPDPPLMTFHWEVYEKCSLGVTICLMYLRDVIAETQLQRVSSTYYVISQMNWTWKNQSTHIQMVNDECLRLKAFDQTKFSPFRGPLDRFRWRATASYFMCWYSMQNITLLSSFREPCDDLGQCYEADRVRDLRADNNTPYQCAMYSFCPDPCCPLRRITRLEECQDVDPCRHTRLTANRCKFPRDKNTWLPSIIYNEWNVSCLCDKGYEWDSRYGMCIDVNECAADSEICDVRTETCVNLPGRHKCVCRWGYTRSADRRSCVQDEAVKMAEIRFASRYDIAVQSSTSEFGINANTIWTVVKNNWQKYAPRWFHGC